jgi:(2Fe-2S) ferredoxin
MDRQVWVCLGASCRRSGSPEVLAQLKQALAVETDVAVTHYLCFGACAVSPNVVVMPERLWYSYAFPEYAARVAEAIQQATELPGLSQHVPPMIRDTVFQKLDKDMNA